MKRALYLLIIFMFSITLYAQDSKWRQKNARINISLRPEFEYFKIAGKFDFAVSFSATFLVNSKYFIGGYLTKKPLNTFIDYSGTKYDASYQHGGFIGGGYIDLGLFRTKGGHYVKRKTMLTYSVKLGAGMVFLLDENKARFRSPDYFYSFQPSFGATRPIGSQIFVDLGLSFPVAYSVDKLKTYFSDSEFIGPGIYLAFRFNLFP